MPSIDRPLSGDVLVHDLADERAHAADPATLARSGRNARTLIKSGALRVTVVALAAGAEIPEHHAGGPITVQPLHGRIRFTAAGTVHELAAGQLLTLGPGIPHSVAGITDASFLLTVTAPAV